MLKDTGSGSEISSLTGTFSRLETFTQVLFSGIHTAEAEPEKPESQISAALILSLNIYPEEAVRSVYHITQLPPITGSMFVLLCKNISSTQSELLPVNPNRCRVEQLLSPTLISAGEPGGCSFLLGGLMGWLNLFTEAGALYMMMMMMMMR